MEKYQRVHFWRLSLQSPWAPIWPLSIGWMRCDKPIIKVKQGYYCINLVTHGELNYTVNHKHSHTLKRGDLYITGPDDSFHYHSLNRTDEEYAQIYWLRMTGPLIKDWFELLGFNESVHVLRNRSAARIESQLKMLIDLSQKTSTSDALETVATLYKLATAIETTSLPFTENAPLSDVILTFMKNELDHGINVNQLCDIFHVSRTTLYNTFKREQGKSPHEVLKDMQADKAATLLTDTDVPLEEVALSCGLSSYLQLSRLTKRRFGVTPKTYRSQSRHAR
ncbi:MAG: AraC family transcriptional regulator [Verrucomicrobiota bacterium]